MIKHLRQNAAPGVGGRVVWQIKYLFTEGFMMLPYGKRGDSVVDEPKVLSCPNRLDVVCARTFSGDQGKPAVSS